MRRDIGSFDPGAESASLDNAVIPWLRERDVAPVNPIAIF